MTNINLQQLELQCAAFIKQQPQADKAHDIQHLRRVVTAAKQFARQEQAELGIVIPAAWLHDCVTVAKNHPQRHLASTLAADHAITFLTSINYPEQYLKAIHHAICAHSYSAEIPVESLEAAIVQDADRIDALGAIGIARCIQVSTQFNAELYCADEPFANVRELDEKQYCIDHFFTKLFTLADTMNTDAARQEANQRTDYMKAFLSQLGHEIGTPFL